MKVLTYYLSGDKNLPNEFDSQIWSEILDGESFRGFVGIKGPNNERLKISHVSVVSLITIRALCDSFFGQHPKLKSQHDECTLWINCFKDEAIQWDPFK